MMQCKSLFLVVLIIAFGALTACGSLGEEIEKDKVHVVSSFSIIHDIVVHIGGDRVEADYLTPLGEDPHEFEPTPSTFKLISDADILFYNGYNLDYWIQGLARNAESTAKEVTLTEGIPAIPLSKDAGDLAEKEDPHAWLNPQLVMIYAENAANALIEADPEGEEYYLQNLEEYKDQLQELDEWIKEQVESIPEQNRLIVISESAFKYFAQGYGFEYDSIWEINAHEEGSPRQISRLIEVIREKGIPAVFLETSVDPRPMEQVASELGIEIAGKVYTDSLGKKDSGAETYIEMMKWNVEVVVEGLTQE